MDKSDSTVCVLWLNWNKGSCQYKTLSTVEWFKCLKHHCHGAAWWAHWHNASWYRFTAKIFNHNRLKPICTLEWRPAFRRQKHHTSFSLCKACYENITNTLEYSLALSRLCSRFTAQTTQEAQTTLLGSPTQEGFGNFGSLQSHWCKRITLFQEKCCPGATPHPTHPPHLLYRSYNKASVSMLSPNPNCDPTRTQYIASTEWTSLSGLP